MGIGLLAAATGLVRVPSASAMSNEQTTRLETLVFQTSLSGFRHFASRSSGIDASFDWSTDLCSAPLVGNTGRSFDFTAPCQRHDFAYRNFKRADRESDQRGRWWNSRMRHRIDLQFLRDMTSHCTQRRSTERTTCRMWAEVFYRVVRVAGGP